MMENSQQNHDSPATSGPQLPKYEPSKSANQMGGDQPAAQGNGGMFERRLNRTGFVLASIFAVLPYFIIAVLQAIVRFILSSDSGGAGSRPLITGINIFSFLIGLVFVFLVIPVVVSIDIRRLHDLNYSGWLILLNFVPFGGFVLGFMLLFLPGISGPNKYGNPVADNSFWVALGLRKPKQPHDDTAGPFVS